MESLTDTESKIYNLIKSCNDDIFVLINPYEIDIFQKNRIEINKIIFHKYDSYYPSYNYIEIIKFYKKEYSIPAKNIYLLGGGKYYGSYYSTVNAENAENIENIYIENEFNCLKYLSKYKDEILLKDTDNKDNAALIHLLTKKYMNNLFYSSINTGIIGVEGYFRFYHKYYTYLDTIDTIYIINRSFDDFCQTAEKSHKSKIVYLNINVGKLFYTNPEFIAFYRSRTDFNNNNYFKTHFNFNSTFSEIVPGIYIGNDSYKYINKGVNITIPEDITHIMNVSNDTIDPCDLPYDNIIYQYFPINEREKDNNISRATLVAAADRLYELIQNDSKVLVHCSVGMNRSPAVVILYFMKYCQMTLYEAYMCVLTKRHIFTSFELFDILYKEAIALCGGDSSKIISPLKIRTNYAHNFADYGAYLFSLYDIMHLEKLMVDSAPPLHSKISFRWLQCKLFLGWR